MLQGFECSRRRVKLYPGLHLRIDYLISSPNFACLLDATLVDVARLQFPKGKLSSRSILADSIMVSKAS